MHRDNTQLYTTLWTPYGALAYSVVSCVPDLFWGPRSVICGPIYRALYIGLCIYRGRLCIYGGPIYRCRIYRALYIGPLCTGDLYIGPLYV